jgi:hypothetical protein
MMKHFTEEELISYQDGEPGQREAIANHLRECAQCREELQRIEEVFVALNAMPVPDPGEDYGRRVWLQIAPRLPEKRTGWWVGWLSAGRLATAGALAAIIVLAFTLGRISKRTTRGSDVADAGQVRERVLVIAVGDHLGRSEMVLMELANARPTQDKNKLINISAEQKRAESLVEENRLYRQSAWSQGDAAMNSTLDELERVLVDIANSPEEITPAQFEAIQKRIESHGILLKVRVVQEELHGRGETQNGAPKEKQAETTERSKT